MAATNRCQGASDARTLRRRATWCGVVFALAVLLTTLNFLPPLQIQYLVRSEVLLSPSRLERLQAALELQSNSEESVGQSPVLLTGISVLDETPLDSARQDGNQRLFLVEVSSRWNRGYTVQRHEAWLKKLTKLEASDLVVDSEAASNGRLLAWQLETTKHYLMRHDFLNTPEPLAGDDNEHTFALAAHANRVPVHMASQSSAEAPTPSSNAAESEERQQLEAQLFELSSAAKRNTQQVQQRIADSAGVLEIAQLPELAARSTTFPLWMAASVIIVGLSAGASAGWTQFHLQSGGAHDPPRVATALAFEGVPIVAEVQLHSHADGRETWIDSASHKATAAKRAFARQLTRFSEWALWFWMYMIVLRFVLDPLWRDVFFTSPLAAFCRLFQGMP
ncbi:hypothetical protein [Aureliella helgolandensis]|uniref:Uncharacterized protein n=1 Tax=Aureliella helgolandensis TaxID=2527968 RepID=A0A518G5V4_9BACT|nr:hypothetical protein [Aureliella helgolandensis]QDV23972.1 hypothetical protein Q31a_22850 [Aureliella helgolandensis]